MRAILEFMLRSRPSAMVSSALALLVPPFGFLAGGVVGVVTLRHGLADGALILAGSVALAAVPMVFLYQAADAAFIFALMTGGPVLLTASVLRATGSLGTALRVVGAVTGGALIAVHLIVADPAQWWRNVMERILRPPISEPGAPSVDAQQLAAYEEVLEILAMSLPVGTMVATVLVLFLARWWHAVLDNPGGFAREFRELRLGRDAAVGTVALLVLAMMAPATLGGLPVQLLQVALALFTFQGIALVHAWVAQREASVAWLLALYLTLVLTMPFAVIIVAALGLTDNWVEFRRRWKAGPPE